MRVAVTGASGFIGRHVQRELMARGVEVVAVSRSAERLAPKSHSCERIIMDITAPPDNPFEHMREPDILLHLAWGGLPNYQSTHHVEIELPAQIAFLDSCLKHGLKRLVVTGTCYEYGLASGELPESTPAQPCTQYGTAKSLLRQKLFALQQQHVFELAWLRLFYLYGEGQSERSLYSLLHAAIDRGDETFDMSGGEQVRDFLPIHEAARLIVEVALHGNANGIFNICSGIPITVQQLVRSWVDASHGAIEMNFGRIPYSPVEPMAFWGNRTRLDTLLSKPMLAKTNLPDSLKSPKDG